MKEETKTNKRECPVSSIRVQDPWRQSGWNRTTKIIDERIVEQVDCKSGVKG